MPPLGGVGASDMIDIIASPTLQKTKLRTTRPARQLRDNIKTMEKLLLSLNNNFIATFLLGDFREKNLLPIRRYFLRKKVDYLDK